MYGLLAPVGANAKGADRAFDYNIETARGIASHEKDFAASEAPLRSARGQSLQVRPVKSSEQYCALQSLNRIHSSNLRSRVLDRSA